MSLPYDVGAALGADVGVFSLFLASLVLLSSLVLVSVLPLSFSLAVVAVVVAVAFFFSSLDMLRDKVFGLSATCGWR